MKGFKSINPVDITENTFKLIGNDWMLITAGNPAKFNTMTASWGGLGVLWNKKVCFCFIRPQRYTFEFMERETNFTLSFFEDKYRPALNLCGTKSGRDIDKVKEAGLTPIEGSSGAVCFNEAKLIIECRKIYFQDIDPANFLEETIEKNYTNKDYHRMYIGEITGCWIKE